MRDLSPQLPQHRDGGADRNDGNPNEDFATFSHDAACGKRDSDGSMKITAWLSIGEGAGAVLSSRR
jgi:hypothetical protein